MRNNKRVIYTSSYDRGLEHLLKIWPDVVSEVPDAELHIYYGWALFERFYANNPERMAWKDKMNKMMEHKGITHFGRVSQDEIMKRMQEAGIWAYPTHFYEISCITAMKAQIAGCVPVCTDYAALDTTVQYGVKISGDIYDPKVLETFKSELIAMLENPEKQESIREKMMTWAKNWFTWSRVAEQWDNLFKGRKVNGLIPKSN